MSERRIHIDDKEKLYNSIKRMRAEFSVKVLSLFNANEVVSTKELSERSKGINSGYRFNKNAINKVLTGELSDKIAPCGKNKWKLKE